MLKNAEGEEKTPSVVYFGEHETLVGTPAEHLLEDEGERERVVGSIKRELANRRPLALPDRRVRPVDVVREVLDKLKRDAEELHFHRPVQRLALTHPAAFDALERDALEQAARSAGFGEVRLLEEPVAAALAYPREMEDAGRNLLVYDLGGGTFDLAVLTREGEGFRLAVEPRGLRRCGGDDFDYALYDHIEDEVLRQLERPLDENGLDPWQLRECRKRKENLTHRAQLTVSLFVAGRPVRFTLQRSDFEARIAPLVETTARLTGELAGEAESRGYKVETVVLIGGASRVPLVQRSLAGALPVEPRKWQHQDVAVALGAAYRGWEVWRESGEDLAWRISQEADTIKTYRAYPDDDSLVHEHAEEAAERMDELAWKEAQTRDTQEAYAAYLGDATLLRASAEDANESIRWWEAEIEHHKLR